MGKYHIAKFKDGTECIVDVLHQTNRYFSFWRGVNIVVLMIAAFVPWLSGSGEIGSIGNGDPIFLPGWFILMFFILQPPALPGSFLYLILSLYKFINSSSWLRYLLFILAGINFLSFAWMIWSFWGVDVLWGYWLMCVGILSSFILETIDITLDR